MQKSSEEPMRVRSRLIGAAVLLAASLLGFDAEAGSVVSQHFASAALGRDWTYNVYLPDSYADGRQRYPVFYLLHGNGGDKLTAGASLLRVAVLVAISVHALSRKPASGMLRLGVSFRRCDG
jgi:hypothetical protein